MKILITGAGGFIGRNLFTYFDQSGYDVWGTYRLEKPFDHPHLLQADLTRREDVARVCAGVDILIHAAAITSGAGDIVSRPYIHVTDNTIMNTLLLQASYDFSIARCLFFSCTVMYPMDRTAPLTEEDVDLGHGIHPAYFGGAWMKTYMEKLCQFYARFGRTAFTVLRHTNIYGPYDSFDPAKAHVFAATILKVMRESHTITVWGDGSEGRDFLYINDLIQCVSLCLEKQSSPFELFNVGFGRSISVHELVLSMIRISGKNLGIEFDRSKPTIKSSLSLDISKIKNTIGWHATTDLDEGIQKTLDWYRAHASVSK